MSNLVVSNISDGTTSVGTGYVVNGSAKAWVDFDGTGTIAARDSLNLSSLTDNGTGNYTATISTSFSSANYASVVSGNNSLSLQYPFQIQNNSTSAYQIGTYNLSTFADMANTHATAFGDLA
jgi:hypothetical protein